MNTRAIVKLHYSCNNHCVFCHSDTHRHICADPENIFSKIDRAPDYGINQILLSGGEPTIYPHLKKILAYLQKNNLSSGFVSNGRMFSYTPFLRNCIKMGADYFYISLHSHNPAVHDLITESKGSWEQAFAGIKNISKFASDNTELIVNCVITKHNIGHLANLVKLLSPLPRIIIKFSLPELKGRALLHEENLVSDLQLVGESINQAMYIADLAGVKCYFDGLPFCCLGSEFRLRFHNLEKSRIFYMSEVFEEVFFRTDESDRAHTGGCDKCSYYEVCDGLYKGYSEQRIAPIEELVPNFFTLRQVATEETSNEPCLLNMSPPQGQLAFKRVGILNEDRISLYEAEDSYFKINNFQRAKKQLQLYFSHNTYEKWDGDLVDLCQIKLLPECEICTEPNCPQVFTRSIGARFADIGSDILTRLEELHGNVLEVGFGDIFFKDLLFDKLKKVINYVGIEPDFGKYDEAMRNFPDVEFHHADLEGFSYQKNFFDFVLMAGSFNHLRDIKKGLEVARDLLRENGRLLIIENSIFGVLEDAPTIQHEELSPAEEKVISFEHYRNATVESAGTFLNHSGFEQVSQVECTPHQNFWMIECIKR